MKLNQALAAVALALVAACAAAASADPQVTSVAIYPPAINLNTKLDRQQFIVVATRDDGVTLGQQLLQHRALDAAEVRFTLSREDLGDPLMLARFDAFRNAFGHARAGRDAGVSGSSVRRIRFVREAAIQVFSGTAHDPQSFELAFKEQAAARRRYELLNAAQGRCGEADSVALFAQQLGGSLNDLVEAFPCLSKATISR